MGKKSNFKKLRQLSEEEQKQLYADLLERTIPVAREVTKLIAAHADTYPFGDNAQASDDSHKLAEEIIALFIERNVRWNDREFIMQLVLQPASGAKDILHTAFDRSWNTLLTGILGKKVTELDFVEVDALMRKGHETDPSAAEPETEEKK